MKNPKFTIFLDKKGEYRFNLKAANGQIILQSEGYKTKAGCQNGIDSVKKNSVLESAYRTNESKNHQEYFVLLAGNNEPIGRSEMYKSRVGMQNGIAAVKNVAPKAPVEELN